MDSLFYRKSNRSSNVKTKLVRLLKNKRFMVRFIIGSAIALYALVGSHGILQRIRLQNQKAELVAKIQAAEEETKRLQSEAKALEGDPQAVEKVAREKYGMIREGETVYKVNRK
ncbi:septum formation initiator family protein [Sphingobacteriales bacterium CHB3]|nr:septum formation initiator family protein [Sphingobacteriales bacterium CHB3]